MKLYFNKIGSGPPIVILHGFLGTSDNWISIGRKLAEKHTVYLVDQRNHGRSDHAEPHDLPSLASDLAELIGDEGLHQPVLVGHSMGGKVVMQFAIEHDNFSKLVIVDIAPKKYKPHHQRIFEGLLSIDLDIVKERSDADDQLARYLDDRAVRQFLLKNLDRTREGFTWKANLELLEKSQEAIGRAIDGQNITEKAVYFIRGDKSDYVLNDDRELIKKLFPGAQILTIKGAGHWVHAEQPDPFLKTLEAILSS